MTPLIRQRKQDEQTLLRLFRCMSIDQQEEVLGNAAAVASRSVSLDPWLPRNAREAKASTREECGTDDLSSRLKLCMPPDDMWDYLDDWFHNAIESAWPEGIGNANGT